jgi:hypothetical protein
MKTEQTTDTAAAAQARTSEKPASKKGASKRAGAPKAKKRAKPKKPTQAPEADYWKQTLLTANGPIELTIE